MSDNKALPIIIIIVIILVGAYLYNNGNFKFLGAITTLDGCNGNQDCIDCISQDSVCVAGGVKYYEYANGVCALGSSDYCANGCAYGHCLEQDYGAVCFPDGTKLCEHTYYEASTGGILCNIDNIQTCSGSCVDGACVSGTSTCSDGTQVGSCSTTKPRECIQTSSGTIGFVNSCTKCGCPSGYTCNSVTDECETSNVNTCQSNGGTCQASSCLDGYYELSYSGCPTNYECCSECTPQASYKCYGNDVYYYDSCGNKGIIKQDCDYGCSNGACTNCQTDCSCAEFTCVGNTCNDGCGGDCEGTYEGNECNEVGTSFAITWTEYYSMSNEEVIDAICDSSLDCGVKEGFTVSCIKEGKVQDRLYEGAVDKCKSGKTSVSGVFGRLINKIIGVYGNICSAWIDAKSLFTDKGACIAESNSTFGGIWDTILKTVGGMGVSAQYVVMATVGGIILIISLVIVPLLKGK